MLTSVRPSTTSCHQSFALSQVTLNLQAEAKSKGWMTEAQLRAAAAVAAKRAADDALHAKQQLAELQSNCGRHQVQNQ